MSKKSLSQTGHIDPDVDLENLNKAENHNFKKQKIEKSTATVSGIIYLSSVPQYMSVQKLRNIFSEYGEVGRTFFQPTEKSYTFKKGLLFTEGWVEFVDYHAAKYVAATLNATQVGGKKRSPWYSCIWTIKFLPNFTWTDVNADRELKRANNNSRMRADIAQVKKQTSFYLSNFETSKVLGEMKKRKEKRGERFKTRALQNGVPQRLTDEEICVQKTLKQSDFKCKGKGKQTRSKTFVGKESESRLFVMKSIFC